MIFHETQLSGAYLIEVERRVDERGFFARTWCQEEFAAKGLDPHLVQCSISFNVRKGTLRGMHYQIDPRPETRLVRCTQGAIHDVIVDLRTDSPTFRQSVSALLTPENRLMFYIPRSFAHGFFTLADNTEVFYQMSDLYSPEHARGARWNDPAFGISWPGEPVIISDRDRTYPDFQG
jgi:dTDP-4-dehydrorhamnose 3,5-epimerase